jgi:hypothetical protein
VCRRGRLDNGNGLKTCPSAARERWNSNACGGSHTGCGVNTPTIPKWTVCRVCSSIRVETISLRGCGRKSGRRFVWAPRREDPRHWTSKQGAAVDQATAPRRSPSNSALSIYAAFGVSPPPAPDSALSWSGTTQPHCGHFHTLPSTRHFPRTDNGHLVQQTELLAEPWQPLSDRRAHLHARAGLRCGHGAETMRLRLASEPRRLANEHQAWATRALHGDARCAVKFQGFVQFPGWFGPRPNVAR